MPNEKMTARLVYDGGSEVFITPEMGMPRDDQMQGTVAEQLTELAGRVCYDSLGKGRPSFSHMSVAGIPGDIWKPQRVEGYHDHILGSGHGSVLEHFNFTVRFEVDPSDRRKRHCLCS